MADSIFVIGCNHKPKIVKKIGVILGDLHQILVCELCRHDPDLQDFSEIPISKEILQWKKSMRNSLFK